MAQELRANTQVKVVVGPAVAVGDGFTPVTTLTLSGADEAELMKHDAASVTDISAATFAAITSADGYYNLTLTTSHTDTEGLMTVLVNDDSLILPIKQPFMVLSEAAWDSKYVAKDDGFMDVNIKTIGRADTQETEASNLESACSNYSATRGLSGTALPAAAADAAGGLIISDAGGFDIDNRAPSATAVTNLNTVYASDFAANYDTTLDKWKANVSHINDVAATSVTTINAVLGTSSAITVTSGGVTLANGVTHGGSTAMLRLGSSSSTPALYVTNSAGVAAQFEVTAGNGTGFSVIGFGTGSGFEGQGGATGGYGWSCQGGATGGAGLRARGGSGGGAGAQFVGGSGGGVDFDSDRTGNLTGDMTIGTLTVTTNAMAWNASWDAEVQSEVSDELTARGYSSTLATNLGTTNSDLADGGRLDLIFDAILVDTGTTLDGRIPAALVNGRMDSTVDATGMESGAVTAILTSQMTESYNTDGTAPTLAQAIFVTMQAVTEFAISSTTKTVKKLDGSTTAYTETLDSATTPTSITRTT